MNDWIELAAVFLLRAIQAAVTCLPTMLCGMLCAGVLQAVIGPSTVRRWLQRDNNGDLLRAWGLAMLLPVCSFGVLPVLFTLRNMGVRYAPLIVVALSAPLATPWSLGFMFDRAGIGESLLVITANATIALAAGWVASGSTLRSNTEAQGLPTQSMVLNTLWFAGRSLDCQVITLLGIGLIGVGIVAVFIPPNAIGDWLVERSPLHALLLSIVPLFTYVTPEIASLQAGEIAHSSHMPGLLVPLVVVGVALNLGTVALLFGIRSGSLIIQISVTVILIGFVIGSVSDQILHVHEGGVEDSHAFEDYGRPFHLLDHPDGAVAGFLHRLNRPLGISHLYAATAVLLLSVGSRMTAYCAKREPTWRNEEWITYRTANWTLSLIGLAMLATTAYTAIPPPAQLARELRASCSELSVAARRGEPRKARGAAAQFERRISLVPASLFLRCRWPSTEQMNLVSNLRQDSSQFLVESATTNRHFESAFYQKLGQLLKTLY